MIKLRTLGTLAVWPAIALAATAFAARAQDDGTPADLVKRAAAPASQSADAGVSTAAKSPLPDSALPPMPVFDRILFAKLHAGVISSDASDNEGHGGKVHAFEICHCNIESLWSVLTNHGPFAEFVPRVESMVITRRTDRSERARQTINATVATVKYSLDYSWDPATRRIDFHLVEDEPHDLKAVMGIWQLWSIDHGKATLLEYTSAVDTGKQIPGFIRDYLADRGVKDTLGAVRTRAESFETHK